MTEFELVVNVHVYFIMNVDIIQALYVFGPNGYKNRSELSPFLHHIVWRQSKQTKMCIVS